MMQATCNPPEDRPDGSEATDGRGIAGYRPAAGMRVGTFPGGRIALALALDGIRMHLPEEQIR